MRHDGVVEGSWCIIAEVSLHRRKEGGSALWLSPVTLPAD